MLSRVADQIMWMSRYIERAANTARFLEVSYHLNLDLQQGGHEQWSPLVEITGDMKIFEARYGEPTAENVMHFLMFNPEYINSIQSCLSAARDNAKGLRESMPAELFEAINDLGKLVPEAARKKDFFHSQILDLCRRVKRECMMISGMFSEIIERGRGYHFWRLGEFMERADKTSRLLHVKYFYIHPQLTDLETSIDDMQWLALLLSLDAREAYHRTHGLIKRDNVIHMIVLNPAFPRAILFCLQSALQSLNLITGHVQGEPHKKLSALCQQLESMSGASIIETGLNEFIEDLQLNMNNINSSIFDHFNPDPTLSTGA
ncbi:alpha-E domain-containing protein [Pontiellaceae bacterium B12219]|nr:alpha-E domain-containing protein [Pontiellaceae bacterium B12219]